LSAATIRSASMSVGRLLGHRRHWTKEGYAHLADAHLVEAAEKVGSTIASAMEAKSSSL
jgi:hypothetical protein